MKKLMMFIILLAIGAPAAGLVHPDDAPDWAGCENSGAIWWEFEQDGCVPTSNEIDPAYGYNPPLVDPTFGTRYEDGGPQWTWADGIHAVDFEDAFNQPVPERGGKQYLRQYLQVVHTMVSAPDPSLIGLALEIWNMQDWTGCPQEYITLPGDGYLGGYEFPEPTSIVDLGGGWFKSIWVTEFSTDGSVGEYSFTDLYEATHTSCMFGMDVPTTGLQLEEVKIDLIWHNGEPTCEPSCVNQGGQMIFSKEGDIWVMDPDGSNVVNITNTPDLSESGARWAPDGTKIVFGASAPGEKRDIYVVNADGSGMVNLMNTPDVHEERPSWSPCGSKIAYASNTGSEYAIYVMDSDGTNRIPLTSGPGDAYPDWSPDGTKIVFVRAMTWGQPISHYQIFVMNSDGTDVQRLTDNNADDYIPVWSPDGSKIAFISTRGGNAWREQIYVMNADGSDQTNITNSSWRHSGPRWSPDGSRLVFQRSPYNTWVSDIWVMDADGGNPVQLTNTPGIPEGGPDWSCVSQMVSVAVDIKPGSCPNPLNVESKGMLPVAILGSEDFDVTDIDIAPTRLAGVPPIRSSLEDVAGPVVGDPVAYWSFDDVGDPGHDDSGNGHNGTVHEATSTDGVCGNALDFNGSSYVDVANAAGLNPTDAITITAWFKADAFALGTYSWPPIVAKYDTGLGGGYDLAIQKVFEGTPRIGASVFTEGGPITLQDSPPAEPISEGIWYFTAMTYDGSTLTLYTGKKGETSLIILSMSGPGSLVTSPSHLNIGRSPYNTSRYFDGVIDEVRIYDRALSASEIAALIEQMCDGKECPCTTAGGDGFTDLTLKFKTRDIVAALVAAEVDLSSGEELTVPLTGALSDGTLIEGADCMVVVGQVPRSIHVKRSDVNKDGIVDILDMAIVSKHWLESSVEQY